MGEEVCLLSKMKRGQGIKQSPALTACGEKRGTARWAAQGQAEPPFLHSKKHPGHHVSHSLISYLPSWQKHSLQVKPVLLCVPATHYRHDLEYQSKEQLLCNTATSRVSFRAAGKVRLERTDWSSLDINPNLTGNAGAARSDTIILLACIWKEEGMNNQCHVLSAAEPSPTFEEQELCVGEI